MRRALVLAAVVVLAACAQAVSSRPESVPSARPFQPPSGWGLFASDRVPSEGPWQLIRINAGDLSDAQPASRGHQYAIASADGSSLVDIDYSRDQSGLVHIIDARTGVERTAFQLPFAAAPTLTRDGSRLLVTNTNAHSWQVFDTSNGRLTGKLERDWEGPFGFWLDLAGRFMYRVWVPGSGFNAEGPFTPVLVKYDLEASREVGHLELEGVKAGVWRSEHVVNSVPVPTSLVQGVALSPDGSQLSVLYGDGRKLMTIDAAALKIVSSRHLSAAHQPTNWFGLLPKDAYAKYEEGVRWNLAYSPDGRRLVASARQTTVDDRGNSSIRGLGIRLIDPFAGILVAQVPNLDVERVLYAPDGSALYATTLLTNGVSTVNRAHLVLLRLDPSTLAVAARREFNEPRTILMLAQP